MLARVRVTARFSHLQTAKSGRRGSENVSFLAILTKASAFVAVLPTLGPVHVARKNLRRGSADLPELPWKQLPRRSCRGLPDKPYRRAFS